MKENIAVVVSNVNKDIDAICVIDSIKKSGFKNVFIQYYRGCNFNPSINEQIEYIRKNNLNIIFAHLGYKDINDIWLNKENGDLLVEQYKEDLDFCFKNNIDMVVMHLVGDTRVCLSEIGIKRLQIICDYADNLGIKVAFENTKFDGYLDYVFSNIKNENVGICFDSGHYHAYFKDKFDFKKYRDKIFAVHLHDNNGKLDQHYLPYDGTNDWDNILYNLKEANFNGYITLEICYYDKYLNMKIDDFYDKAFKLALKLNDKYTK